MRSQANALIVVAAIFFSCDAPLWAAEGGVGVVLSDRDGSSALDSAGWQDHRPSTPITSALRQKLTYGTARGR
jgi:hypothetical protein